MIEKKENNTPDKRDFIIELMRQQREEAQNRTITVAAEASVKIAELEAEIKVLKAKLGQEPDGKKIEVLKSKVG